MAGKEFIVDGAVCMCKYGTAPGKLQVTDDFLCMNGGKPAASTMLLGNVMYPPGCGSCRVNPLFPKPCVPAVTVWTGQYDPITFMYGHPLTDASKGTCSNGGPDCIEFVQTGQIPVPGAKQMAQATAEHQGELDPMGEPAALTEHPVVSQLPLAGQERKVLVTAVKGPVEAFAGQKVKYEVERYNVRDVNEEVHSQVKWKVTVDDREIAITQPHKEVLELPVKNEWQGKQIVAKAYIQTPSEKVCRKTQVQKEYERIIVIGTQQHSDSLGRNISPFHDVGPNSKFMFVHQALRRVLLNTEYRWTILLCIQGYSETQQQKIKSTFENITDKNEEKVVTVFENISSPGNIVNYINNGNGRDARKIDRLLFYSHGVVNKILPWMKGLREGEALDKTIAQKLKASSFSDDALIYSFACRTGLGNPQIDKTVYINKTKNMRYNLLSAQSLAQKFADVTEAMVYAYLKRSDYSDTLFTADDYDFMDVCNAVKYGIKREREAEKYNYIIQNGKLNKSDQERYEKLDAIRKSDQMVDGATFRATGALHPVKAGQTPEGLPGDMKTYKQIVR